MILYHGTAAANLDAIKAQGLIPRGGLGADEWAMRNSSFGDVMRRAVNRHPDRAKSVYLAAEADRALDFAELAAAMLNSEPVVLKVELPDAKGLIPDENSRFSEAYRFVGTIPPADIVGPVDVQTEPWRLPYDIVMQRPDL